MGIKTYINVKIYLMEQVSKYLREHLMYLMHYVHIGITTGNTVENNKKK